MTDKIMKRKPRKVEVKVLRGYRFSEDTPTRRKGQTVKVGSLEREYALSLGYIEGGE